MFRKIVTVVIACCGFFTALHAEHSSDLPSGPNHWQTAPQLSSARQSCNRTQVEGKLCSVQETTFIIQFFNNDDGSDEGAVFLGQIQIKTDHKGRASFQADLPMTCKNSTITATATRVHYDTLKDTSEFSKTVKVK